MSVDYHFDQLISSVYESVTDAERWQQVLMQCGKLLNGADGYMTTVQRKTQQHVSTVTAGILFSSSFQEHYCNYFVQFDPFLHYLRNAMLHQWFCSHLTFNENFVQRNVFYQHFLMPQGLCYSLFAAIDHDDGDDTMTIVVFVRQMSQQPFSDAEKCIARRISGHMQNAMTLQKLNRKLHMQARIGASVFDALAMSMFIIDAHCTVWYLNADAKRLISDQTNGFGYQNGCLSLLHADNECFVNLVASATNASAAGGAMPLQELGSHVLIHPLPEQTPQESSVPLALILIVEGGKSHVTLELVGNLYKLSPAELRLSEAVLAGESPESYAQRTGVSLNTVRSQLKNVFKKTGTTRQSELVALLCQFPNLNQLTPFS